MEKQKLNFKNLIKENLIYIIIFILDLILICVNRAINGFGNILWVSDLSSFFGILNVIFTAKHTIFGLIFNLISTIFISVTSIYQKLWLNAVCCIFISVPSLLIGIIKWHKNEKSGNGQNLNTLSKKSRIFAFVSFIIVSIIALLILKYFNGNLYYLDAFYSISCVYGILLCSFAFIDQFKYFITSNVIGIVMYTILTIQNINNLPFLFTTIIYLIVNIMGYINWIKIKKNIENNKRESKEFKNELNTQQNENQVSLKNI